MIQDQGLNNRWRIFLHDYGKAPFGYDANTKTYEDDYQACKKDFEAGVPRAIKYMMAFAKFRLKS